MPTESKGVRACACVCDIFVRVCDVTEGLDAQRKVSCVTFVCVRVCACVCACVCVSHSCMCDVQCST
jgi:hypothetical protein